MSGTPSFRAFLAELRPEIERALDELLPAAAAPPERLHEAMRHAVFAGGKRFRPALVVVAGERFGAPRRRLLPGAAAVELIHTYSLVHDDLPALDDDDLRRGRPTLHLAFDEATAILAGDALLTLGLTALAARPDDVPAAARALAAAQVGEAIGTAGMIGGQVEDLAAERAWPADPAAALERIHLGKTAALIGAALRLGGLYAGAGEAADAALARLGRSLGLLFQIGDDLLDVEGSERELGKTPGKDAASAKLTYPALYGVAETRRRLAEVAAEAHALGAALPAAEEPGGGGAKLLHSLIDFLAERTS
ncbi:MAG: polyprenyl synthetase family protein [Thermoanaerobaculia bacterium]|nr:polyprenyl synthetase family protein [Thermoanaerobaculia bacterium]